MTVVLHSVDLHGLAATLADVPANVTLLPLSDGASAPDCAADRVLAPADDRELQALLPWLAAQDEPALVLLGGPAVLRVHGAAPDVSFPTGEVLLEGTDGGVAVLTCGAQVGEALSAAMDLQTQGIRPRVVSLTSLRPLDVDRVRQCAATCGALLVVEAPLPEGVVRLADAVRDALRDADVPVTVLGQRQAPIPEGDEALVHPFGPTARDIRVAVTRLVKA